MMGTTAGGLRYPEPTDPVAAGADNIKNLATDVDTTKYAKAGGPISGAVSITGALTANGDAMDAAGFQSRTDGASRMLCSAAGVATLRLARALGAGSVDPGQQFVTMVRGTSTGSAVGSISLATTSSVAYNTTSDARLKERTGDVADAAELVHAIGALAYRGRWITDEGEGEEWVFVNSQDVESVAPFAVHGAPDGTATAEDVAAERAAAEGEIIPQQLDAGALVPLLLAAVSQLVDRVAALEGGAP